MYTFLFFKIHQFHSGEPQCVIEVLNSWSRVQNVLKPVNKSRCGREVKAIDLKSISLRERRFEPYHLRLLLILLVYIMGDPCF